MVRNQVHQQLYSARVIFQHSTTLFLRVAFTHNQPQASTRVPKKSTIVHPSGLQVLESG